MNLLELIHKLQEIHARQGDMPVAVEVKDPRSLHPHLPGEWRDLVSAAYDTDADWTGVVLEIAPPAVDQLTAEAQKNGEYE